MAIYLTLMTDNGFVGILQAFNTYSGGYFGIMLLFAFSAIIFMSVSVFFGGKKALTTASIFALIVSYPLLVLSLVTTAQFWVVVILCLVLSLISIYEKG